MVSLLHTASCVKAANDTTRESVNGGGKWHRLVGEHERAYITACNRVFARTARVDKWLGFINCVECIRRENAR